MMPENALTAIFKEILQAPGLIKEIYGDLAKPGVTQVGKALGTILGLGNTILWRLELINERSKITLINNMEKYREQIKDIPEDKITEVTPEIGVPILEKLSYVTDDHISSLYINLLTKASNMDTLDFAHPSFVNIINNLSPDEALLIPEIEEIPFIDFHLKKGEIFKILYSFSTGLENKIKLAFPKNIAAYLSNFEGLGLITAVQDMHLDPPTQWEDLENFYRPTIEKIPFVMEQINNGFSTDIHRGIINATPFGELFKNACLNNHPTC